MDYSKMSEVYVHNQAEMDAIPLDYRGHIYIVADAVVSISNRYCWSVTARENSTVTAWENSTVTARENSTVTAWENSTVTAWENSTVTARENSTVTARESSTVTARGNSTVTAWENSTVTARENSTVTARENSTVTARENSTVTARGNSTVTAWENSTVTARENSTVTARENSTVTAWENSTVTARENSTVTANANVQVAEMRYFHGKIKVSGNARIVRMPKCIGEFFDFHGIKHTKTYATMYKAVHKINGEYVADYDRQTKYKIGEYAKVGDIDTDLDEDCGRGIHIAHLDWALTFGNDWDDLAILECKVKISDIIMPNDTDGKVRTSKIKVIREMPLDECGAFGKVLQRRLTND